MTVDRRSVLHERDATQFSPALLRLQDTVPSPMPRRVTGLVIAMVLSIAVWSWIGRLDVVAIAHGKLVPAGHLKVVQPAEGGVAREILVNEGDRVRAGQILVRMDDGLARADRMQLSQDRFRIDLTLRRIDAELSGSALARSSHDPARAWEEARQTLDANRAAFHAALAAERTALERARHDHAAAIALAAKLEATLASHRDEEEAWEQLHRDGFAGRLQARGKARQRSETEQELQAQRHAIAAAREGMEQSEKRLAQIAARRREELMRDRTEATASMQRVEQETTRQEVRDGHLELRAPQDALVKDLATHTPGAVVAPGTVLMTLVPLGDALRAEVWVDNEDIGFVREGQPVSIKLAAFPFQKYGLLQGTVRSVSVDATERTGMEGSQASSNGPSPGLNYRTVIDIANQRLRSDGVEYPLVPGMRIDAEIRIGQRRAIDYVLSPLRKAFHEAGRER